MHPTKMLQMNIKDLAAVTYTSSSCITRFCKKVGSKSFPNFKIEFAIAYTSQTTKQTVGKKPLRNEMTTQEVMDILPRVYTEAYIETKNLLDENIINRAINFIIKSTRVDIYGESINFYIAQKVSYSLQSVGINAFAHSVSNQDYMRRQAQNKELMYSIIISHTGTNESMLKIAIRLKELKLRSLLIVGIKDSDIATYCDDTLLFSTSVGALDLYPIRSSCALEYVFDILFAKVIISKYLE